MIGSTLRTMTVVAAACRIAGCGRDPTAELERQCRAAYDASRWADAAPVCAQAAGSERPDLLVLAARAWAQNDDPDRALAAAERAFATPVDATARQIAGLAREDRNEHVAAQILLTDALISHAGHGDHLEAARDAHGLVGVLLHQRRLTEALDAAGVCVREAERAGDRRLLGYGHLARADVLTKLGDAPAARQAFVDAASILGAWPRDAVWVLLKHGLLVLDLQDAAAAVDLLGRALVMANRNQITDVVNAAHLNLAVAEQVLGHAAAAQDHLEAVPAKVRESSSANYVAARLAADRGDLAAAARLFEAAAKHPEDDDYAWEIASQLGALAERVRDFDKAAQRYRDAIAIVETIRARTAARELRPWLLARRREPYEALFALLAAQHRDVSALVIAEQLHARTWLDAVVEQATPRARSTLPTATLAAPPLSSRDLLAMLGDREALVFVTAGRTLWRIHVGGAPRVSLAWIADGVYSLLAAWRDHPDDAELAEQLGVALVPERLAASDRPLYIVAPGSLADLPFAALRRTGHLLIEDRPLVRLPGLAALRCRPSSGPTGEPVLLADVRGDLPLSRAETEASVVAAGGHVYVGAAATLERATSAQHARLFHAAVHAGVDAASGGLEFIDGRLSGAEIIAQGVAPEIAVLAGCNTGGSRDDEGWGALPSALLVAGTRTVVATLRPVRDHDAAAMIREFYRADGSHQPARALQIAQLALVRDGSAPGWIWFAAWGHADIEDCRAAPAPSSHAPVTHPRG